MRNPPTTEPGADEITYRCQFCNHTAPAGQWGQGGMECPKCHRLYIPEMDVDDD